MKAFLILFYGIFCFAVYHSIKYDMGKRYTPAVIILGCMMYAGLLSSAIYFTIWGIRLALSM